jgi:hypothetical protein
VPSPLQRVHHVPNECSNAVADSHAHVVADGSTICLANRVTHCVAFCRTHSFTHIVTNCGTFRLAHCSPNNGSNGSTYRCSDCSALGDTDGCAIRNADRSTHIVTHSITDGHAVRVPLGDSNRNTNCYTDCFTDSCAYNHTYSSTLRNTHRRTDVSANIVPYPLVPKPRSRPARLSTVCLDAWMHHQHARSVSSALQRVHQLADRRTYSLSNSCPDSFSLGVAHRGTIGVTDVVAFCVSVCVAHSIAFGGTNCAAFCSAYSNAHGTAVSSSVGITLGVPNRFAISVAHSGALCCTYSVPVRGTFIVANSHAHGSANLRTNGISDGYPDSGTLICAIGVTHGRALGSTDMGTYIFANRCTLTVAHHLCTHVQPNVCSDSVTHGESLHVSECTSDHSTDAQTIVASNRISDGSAHSTANNITDIADPITDVVAHPDLAHQHTLWHCVFDGGQIGHNCGRVEHSHS